MKKTVLCRRLELEFFEGFSCWQILLPVSAADADETLLAMTYLKYDARDALVIVHKESKILFRKEDTNCLLSHKDKNLSLGINEESLDFLISYLAIYSANQQATVPHIDLDFTRNDHDVGTLTITASEYDPPISADDARNLLDEND